jgi:L-fuculose-phosphate aldolase
LTNVFQIKRDIVEVGRRVYARGYVASNDGNISARVDEKRVMITPTGISKGFMTPEDMLLVDMDGKVLSGTRKPSSEMFMHLAVYKNRPDIWGVCHAHPPYATGFAVAGIPLDKCILPEVVIVLGGIPIVEYGTPGTEEFFRPVLKILDKYDAFLLANHGALTIGKDLFNAYYKMETLEHFAHIAFVAQQLGHMNVLNREQVQKLTDLRQKFGIKSTVGCATCDDDASCAAPPSGSVESALPAGVDKEELIRNITEAILKRLPG